MSARTIENLSIKFDSFTMEKQDVSPGHLQEDTLDGSDTQDLQKTTNALTSRVQAQSLQQIIIDSQFKHYRVEDGILIPVEFQIIEQAKENYKLMVKSNYFSNKLDVKNLKLKAMSNSEIVFNNEYA